MAMKEKKESMIEVIKLPIILLLVLTIIGELLKQVPLFSGILTIISLIVVGYVGWLAVKRYKFTLVRAALAGALVFFIVDLIYFVGMMALGVPILEAYGVDLIEYNVPSEAVGMATSVIVIVTLIFSVIFGAILALIGGVVAKKLKKPK